jgi:tRNA threonylcarbamoyladenosine biosynthesis protein TsaB
MILALDTSTDIASIALYRRGEGIVGEQTWLSSRQQTVQLLPSVQRLMSLLDITPRDLDGIAVATGPGSYSGVRIAVSTAKSLAYSLEVPLYGVPSLDVLAYSHVAVTAAQVCAVLNMGRNRLAWALYRTRGTQWRRLTPYANNTPAEMAESVRDYETNLATLFCGELNAPALDVIKDTLGVQASVSPPSASLRRSGYLAELALQRADRGESDDPATLQALYIQPLERVEAPAG